MSDKQCSSCKERKPLTDFHKNCTTKSGLAGKCKPCNNAYKQAWRVENPEVNRRSGGSRCGKKRSRRSLELRRLYPYGITPCEYTALRVAHGDRCAICGQQDEGRALAIDHCHTTGKVRGLLCRSCNVGLGCFRDNPQLLDSATAYLNR